MGGKDSERRLGGVECSRVVQDRGSGPGPAVPRGRALASTLAGWPSVASSLERRFACLSRSLRVLLSRAGPSFLAMKLRRSWDLGAVDPEGPAHLVLLSGTTQGPGEEGERPKGNSDEEITKVGERGFRAPGRGGRGRRGEARASAEEGRSKRRGKASEKGGAER